MREALSKLGTGFSGNRVSGVGGAFPVKKADLFLGNAGTAFRPLAAALAFCEGEYKLSGVPRMHERPIGDLVDALRGIGAKVDYRQGRLSASGHPLFQPEDRNGESARRRLVPVPHGAADGSSSYTKKFQD
jgi:5-enolpyruvylshikimate-3-phosphate synthase